MDRAYWTKQLQEAERELDAATTRTTINAAARKLQAARAELTRLDEQEKPKRPSRGRGSAGRFLVAYSVSSIGFGQTGHLL
jgi:hypothetical protein